jgi:hypothetical protein
MHKAPGITKWICSVSADVMFPAVRLRCIHRLQTVLHSILSTRVVLHTATVLKQEIVDSRATGILAQNQRSTGMRFAEVTIERVPEV